MVNTKEIPPEAILLGVYLELQNGWFSTRSSAMSDFPEHQTFIKAPFSRPSNNLDFLCSWDTIKDPISVCSELFLLIL